MTQQMPSWMTESQPRRHRRRARRHRQQEGAIMLVVMLILLTATAMASVSLQATQTELRAAGSNRIGVQTQYASEAATSTTLAWVDATSLAGDFVTRQLQPSLNDANLPPMAVFGEPEVDKNHRGFANRTSWRSQRDYITYQTAPITAPGKSIGGTGLADPIGTFGPRSAYTPGVPPAANEPTDLNNYIVDLYDCQPLPPIAAIGSTVNDQGSSIASGRQWYCVITARGSSYLPGAATKKWKLAGGKEYTASRFMTTHEMRITVITPVILGQ